MVLPMLTFHKRLYASILALATISAMYLLPRLGISTLPSPSHLDLQGVATPPPSPAASLPDPLFDLLAQYLVNYPPAGENPGDQFGELGARVRILREWMVVSESRGGVLDDLIEQVATATFPFLRHPSRPDDKAPLSSLRKSFVPGSHGIVIPTGQGTFRFACHLVLAIRNVHHSPLPIQIVYAGNDDLSYQHRQVLASLAEGVEFVDILQVFDDELLKLAHGGWAIKPYAALASSFEKIILLDADAVFVQAPEAVFKQQGFKDTGVFLYHDRLLWQHAFQSRHDWWKKQMEHHSPSPALLHSLVWTEDYAEEADSGLVVLDKSRLPVLTGLLHVCWQNTYTVREEFTYGMTYGDKETWWLGFELSGTSFAFEKHYGSMVGWRTTTDTAAAAAAADHSEKVCSFTIAHTDDADRLLWYNGSLLKNKAVDDATFDVPTHWMMDGVWLKGGSKPEMSCMQNATARELTAAEREVIERSIQEAKRFDSLDQSRLGR